MLHVMLCTRMLREPRREAALRRSALELQQAGAACGQCLRRLNGQDQAQALPAHRCREYNHHYLFIIVIIYHYYYYYKYRFPPSITPQDRR